MRKIAELSDDEAGLDVHLCGTAAPNARCAPSGCARFPVRFLVALGVRTPGDDPVLTRRAQAEREERAGLGPQATAPVADPPAGRPTVEARWPVPDGADPAVVDAVGVALEPGGDVVLTMELGGGPAVVRPGEALEVTVVGGIGAVPASVSWMVTR